MSANFNNDPEFNAAIPKSRAQGEDTGSLSFSWFWASSRS